MRKVLALLLVSFVAYATETTITMNLTESKELLPDYLSMNLSVTAKAQKESEVINMLGNVDKAVRSLGLKYTGGRYWVGKRCWWENGRFRCLGYEGRIRYTFELKDPKEQNYVLEVIDSFKDRYGESMSYSVSEPKWSISEKHHRNVEKELRFSIIDSAKELTDSLSKRLNKECFIQTIDFTTRMPPIEPYTMRKGIEAPEPSVEGQTLNVDAVLRLVCK